MTTPSTALLSAIEHTLRAHKAEDIVQIDLRGTSTIGDFMVICSGRSARQVIAIAEKLIEHLKQLYHMRVRVEGKAMGDWVLIDAHDVIVHVFRPEVRAFYQLERLWQSQRTVGE